MLAITLRNLWAHKRRLLSTFLAITLGVAFLSGTLVLGDTMRATFASLFQQANAGTDVVISGAKIESEMATERGVLDLTLADRLRAVDGVGRIQPVVEGYGKLVGKDG